MNSVESATTADANIDGGWGWVIVFITFVIHLICDGFLYSFGVFYIELLEYFDTTGGATSLVMSLFVGMCYCTGPIASGLINQYGCRIVSFVGTAVSCAGLLLSLAAPRIEYLYLTVGLIGGFGLGLLYLPTIVSVALHFEKKRATAIGISMAGSGIGSLLLAPFLEWLINYYHYWKGAFLIGIGLILNCLVLSIFYHPFTCFESKIDPIEESSRIVTSVEPSGPSTSCASNLAQTHTLSTQTVKKNESIQGMYTISSNVPSNRSISSRSTSVTSHSPGLMQKPDILYTGSSKNLLLTSESTFVGMRKRGPFIEFFKTVNHMIGLSLLKNCAFLIFSFSTFLQYMGLNAPYVYMYHRSSDLNIASGLEASLLLSLMGIANTAGKIVLGLWADKASYKILHIYAMCLLVNGITTMMTSLITHYYQMAIYSFVYGFTWGGSISLSSIVLVELLGMNKLNNAYGLFLLFTGVATAVGTPMTGLLHDVTDSYDAGFYLSGGLITLGSLILFIIPNVQKKCLQ